MSLTIALAPHENPRIDAMTEPQRLRWVLEFIRRDLNALSSEMIEALGDDLIHAAAPLWVRAGWMDGKIRPCTDIPAADVRTWQEELRTGVHACIDHPIDTRTAVDMSLGREPPQGWVLPSVESRMIRVTTAFGHMQISDVSPDGTDRTAVVNGVARLVIQYQDGVVSCPVCGAIFLRQSRQEYCTVRCSNKVRNRRRLDRKAHQQNSHKHGVRRSADTASLTMA